MEAADACNLEVWMTVGQKVVPKFATQSVSDTSVKTGNKESYPGAGGVPLSQNSPKNRGHRRLKNLCKCSSPYKYSTRGD
jgi:hypothetical protein